MASTKKIRASNGIGYTTGGVDYSNPQGLAGTDSFKGKILPKVPIPTQDRIVVTRKKPETVSQGGIILPEMALPKETEGFVVAIGPRVGATERAVAGTDGPVVGVPKVGDHIYFGQYAGTEFPYEGQEYLIMRESDVLMILP